MTSSPDGVLTIVEIEQLLPHRYPFLLVDRVLSYTPDVSITAIKNVTINEPFFQGHFPGSPVMGRLLNIISQHHERLDGSGYPAGLTEQDILLQSRIIAIVDIYDAITMRRATVRMSSSSRR